MDLSIQDHNLLLCKCLRDIYINGTLWTKQNCFILLLFRFFRYLVVYLILIWSFLIKFSFSSSQFLCFFLVNMKYISIYFFLMYLESFILIFSCYLICYSRLFNLLYIGFYLSCACKNNSFGYQCSQSVDLLRVSCLLCKILLHLVVMFYAAYKFCRFSL